MEDTLLNNNQPTVDISSLIKEDKLIAGAADNDPAIRLLLDYCSGIQGKVLLLEPSSGALGLRCAKSADSLLCCHSRWEHYQGSILVMNHLKTSRKSAEVPLKFECMLSDIPRPQPGQAGSFDHVIFRIYPGTMGLNTAVVQAWDFLKPGGSLVICGQKNEGIKSLEKRVSIFFGNKDTLTIKYHCRLNKFCKEEGVQGPAPSWQGYYNHIQQTFSCRGRQIQYSTKPGVFSYRGTDKGSQFLIDNLPDFKGRRVLDLACGAGILSLTACQLGAASITGVDNNIMAVTCARDNLTRHLGNSGIPFTILCQTLQEPVPGEFDIVVSNPPFHTEKQINSSLSHQVVQLAYKKLKYNGCLYLVANDFINFTRIGNEHFQQVNVIARMRGFAVYKMIKLPA